MMNYDVHTDCIWTVTNHGFICTIFKPMNMIMYHMWYIK